MCRPATLQESWRYLCFPLLLFRYPKVLSSIPVVVWQSCLDLLLQLYLCLLIAYIRYCADLRKLWTLHLGNFFNSTFSYRIRVTIFQVAEKTADFHTVLCPWNCINCLKPYEVWLLTRIWLKIKFFWISWEIVPINWYNCCMEFYSENIEKVYWTRHLIKSRNRQFEPRKMWLRAIQIRLVFLQILHATFY